MNPVMMRQFFMKIQMIMVDFIDKYYVLVQQIINVKILFIMSQIIDLMYC